MVKKTFKTLACPLNTLACVKDTANKIFGISVLQYLQNVVCHGSNI